MLLKVKFFGHEIGYITIKPIHSKVAATHKIPSPTGEVAPITFIKALNVLHQIHKKIHINLKQFYHHLHDTTPWNWTDEHERLFQTLKTSLKQNLQFQIQNIHFLLQ